MAKRRMFSLDIIDTDVFLEMPQTSRLLYYELCMRADDDGFVSSPKKIMRTVGCNEDDFRILIARQFIIPFENGVVVIRHWKIHNYIRSDRYTETIYVEQKKQLIQEENGIYKKLGIPNDNPVAYQMDTQVRIGKDSIGKDSREENRKEIDYNRIIEIYNLNCPNLPQIKKLTDKRKKAIKKFMTEFKEEQFEEICRIANKTKFLTGENDRGWKADFDFLMRIDKATSILEGKYSGKEEHKEQLKEPKDYKENTMTEAEYFKNGGGKRYV